MSEGAIRAEDHLRLVYMVAHRLRHLAATVGWDFEDLVSYGTIGLCKARDGFDPARCNAFSTYAVPMIYGEMRRALRDQLPKGYRRGEPDPPDFVSLDAQIPGDDDTDTWGEVVTDFHQADPADAALSAAQVDWLLQDLSERDAAIVRMRWLEGHGQIPIAAEFGVAQPTVSQLLAAARQTMRARLAANGEAAAVGDMAAGARRVSRTPLGIDGDVVRRLTVQGKHRDYIAAHFGVTVDQLLAWCTNHGVPRPPRAGAQPPDQDHQRAQERAQDMHRALAGGDDDPGPRVVVRGPAQAPREGVMPSAGATRTPRPSAAAPMSPRETGGGAAPVPLPGHDERAAEDLRQAVRDGTARVVVPPRRITVWVRNREGLKVPVDLECPQVADIDVAVTFAWAFGFELHMGGK